MADYVFRPLPASLGRPSPVALFTFGPLAYVQSNANSTASSLGTLTAVYSLQQNALSSSVVFVMCSVAGDVTSVTDTSGNAYTLVASQTNGIYNGYAYLANSVAAAAAGANTVTVAFSTTGLTAVVEIEEISGPASLDSTAVAAPNTQNPSVSLTTIAAVTRILSASFGNNTSAPTAGTGLTARQSGTTTATSYILEDELVGSSGAQTVASTGAGAAVATASTILALALKAGAAVVVSAFGDWAPVLPLIQRRPATAPEATFAGTSLGWAPNRYVPQEDAPRGTRTGAPRFDAVSPTNGRAPALLTFLAPLDAPAVRPVPNAALEAPTPGRAILGAALQQWTPDPTRSRASPSQQAEAQGPARALGSTFLAPQDASPAAGRRSPTTEATFAGSPLTSAPTSFVQWTPEAPRPTAVQSPRVDTPGPSKALGLAAVQHLDAPAPQGRRNPQPEPTFAGTTLRWAPTSFVLWAADVWARVLRAASPDSVTPTDTTTPPTGLLTFAQWLTEPPQRPAVPARATDHVTPSDATVPVVLGHYVGLADAIPVRLRPPRLDDSGPLDAAMLRGAFPPPDYVLPPRLPQSREPIAIQPSTSNLFHTFILSTYTITPSSVFRTVPFEAPTLPPLVPHADEWTDLWTPVTPTVEYPHRLVDVVMPLDATVPPVIRSFLHGLPEPPRWVRPPAFDWSALAFPQTAPAYVVLYPLVSKSYLGISGVIPGTTTGGSSELGIAQLGAMVLGGVGGTTPSIALPTQLVSESFIGIVQAASPDGSGTAVLGYAVMGQLVLGAGGDVGSSALPGSYFSISFITAEEDS